MEKDHQISYPLEVLRKLIHLSSIWMALAAAVLSRGEASALFFALLVGAMGIEALRRRGGKPADMFNRLFGPMLRKHELAGEYSVTGATHLVLAALLAVVMFTKPVAVAALSVMVISDSAAALVGRKFGKHRVFNKSVEGSLTFFSSALLVVCVTGVLFWEPKQFYIAGAIAVPIATLVELFSHRIRLDDNLTITLVMGIVMTLAGAS